MNNITTGTLNSLLVSFPLLTSTLLVETEEYFPTNKYEEETKIENLRQLSERNTSTFKKLDNYSSWEIQEKNILNNKEVIALALNSLRHYEDQWNSYINNDVDKLDDDLDI